MIKKLLMSMLCCTLFINCSTSNDALPKVLEPRNTSKFGAVSRDVLIRRLKLENSYLKPSARVQFFNPLTLDPAENREAQASEQAANGLPSSAVLNRRELLPPLTKGARK